MPVVRLGLDVRRDNYILLVAADHTGDSVAALLARILSGSYLHQSTVYPRMKENPFTEDYFMRGVERGLSNYENYRWLGEPTLAACRKIIEYLGMRPGDSIVDIGAALGFYVKALRMLGMRAYGVDISEFAVSNCDPSVKEWMSTTLPVRAFDWAMLKDQNEHLTYPALKEQTRRLNDTISKGIFVIVPLAEKDGGKYVRREDELDSTHIIRWTLDGWINFFEENATGFDVNASYNINGIKEAAFTCRHSCGFFTLIRP